MEKKKLIIVGDSAFAEIAKEYFDEDSPYRVVGFSVEQAFLRMNTLHGVPVVSFETVDTFFPPDEHSVYVAATYTQFNRLRTRLAADAKAKGYSLASYVSSRAFVWKNVKLGEHVFIFEDNTVQPCVTIGTNVILWSGNHIGHHSIIRDNAFISSHVVISGFCDIGENSFLGVNATVANNVTIARDNWIGPNITITKNTEPNTLFKAEQPQPAKVSSTRFFKVD